MCKAVGNVNKLLRRRVLSSNVRAGPVSKLANAIKNVAPAGAPVQNTQGLANVIGDLRRVLNRLVALRGGADGVRSQTAQKMLAGAAIQARAQGKKLTPALKRALKNAEARNKRINEKRNAAVAAKALSAPGKLLPKSIRSPGAVAKLQAKLQKLKAQGADPAAIQRAIRAMRRKAAFKAKQEKRAAARMLTKKTLTKADMDALIRPMAGKGRISRRLERQLRKRVMALKKSGADPQAIAKAAKDAAAKVAERRRLRRQKRAERRRRRRAARAKARREKRRMRALLKKKPLINIINQELTKAQVTDQPTRRRVRKSILKEASQPGADVAGLVARAIDQLKLKRHAEQKKAAELTAKMNDALKNGVSPLDTVTKDAMAQVAGGVSVQCQQYIKGRDKKLMRRRVRHALAANKPVATVVERLVKRIQRRVVKRCQAAAAIQAAKDAGQPVAQVAVQAAEAQLKSVPVAEREAALKQVRAAAAAGGDVSKSMDTIVAAQKAQAKQLRKATRSCALNVKKALDAKSGVRKTVKLCLQEGLQSRLRLSKGPKIPKRALRAATAAIRRANKSGKPVGRVLSTWVSRLYSSLKRRVRARKHALHKLQQLEASGKLNAVTLRKHVVGFLKRALKRKGKKPAAVPKEQVTEAVTQILNKVAEKTPLATAFRTVLNDLIKTAAKNAAEQEAAADTVKTAIASGEGLGAALSKAAGSPKCNIPVSHKMKKGARRSFKRCMRRRKNVKRCHRQSTKRMRKYIRKVCKRNRKHGKKLQKASGDKTKLKAAARKYLKGAKGGKRHRRSRVSGRLLRWFLRRLKAAISQGKDLGTTLNSMTLAIRKRMAAGPAGGVAGGMGMPMGGRR